MNPTSIQSVFDRGIRTADGCLEWQNSTTKDGYGLVWTGDKVVRVHRWIYEQENGPLSPGLEVLHKCDNPPCFELSHLFSGTQNDNVQDMVRKGRHGNTRKSCCVHGHEFTLENTYISPIGKRACRTCIRESTRRYKQKLKDMTTQAEF